MEGPSNGGLLYHEVQESKLCAVHCVNTALQGPFFSEFDLANIASDLDRRERQMLNEDDGGGMSADFLAADSHNVSVGGDFSIQVLEKALDVWNLRVIPLDSPAAAASKYDPELESAFICHLHNHWFCIRKVNGEWYNFNSLYAAPQHLSKFYLSAYMDTLKGSGWSIFLVRGNFPRECPAAAEASNHYSQWLTPEDAKKITMSCGLSQAPPARTPQLTSEDIITEQLTEQEEQDLNAAIAASLKDSSSFSTVAEESSSKLMDTEKDNTVATGTLAGETMDDKDGSTVAGEAMDEKDGSTVAGEAMNDKDRFTVAGEAMDDKDGSESGSAASEASIMSRHDKSH